MCEMWISPRNSLMRYKNIRSRLLVCEQHNLTHFDGQNLCRLIEKSLQQLNWIFFTSLVTRTERIFVTDRLNPSLIFCSRLASLDLEGSSLSPANISDIT